MYQLTTATKKIARLKRRIRAVQGGTSASKTISILLLLIDLAQASKKPLLISVVSESMPHLKRGAMRDFLNIMQLHGYYDDNKWNRTDYIYTFENGSQIEFFGADSPDKLRGPRRDVLYINECNNVPYAAFDQLEVRTKNFVYLDWNPTNEFWFYTDVKEQRKEELDHIVITYKDNEALDEAIVRSIEARKGNAGWWKVYGEGQLGEVEGKVYKDWAIIDEIPHEARLERYGLDFGYTNDPTAIVAIYYYNGGYILDEICYQPGLQNREIADILKNVERAMIRADSAEPKSIDEIATMGLTIIPCTKGRDSIMQGIQNVQSRRISVTKRSLNILKEYRNYMFQQDRNTGKFINEPIDFYNHAMDALRYGFEGLRVSNLKNDTRRSAARFDPITGRRID